MKEPDWKFLDFLLKAILVTVQLFDIFVVKPIPKNWKKLPYIALKTVYTDYPSRKHAYIISTTLNPTFI